MSKTLLYFSDIHMLWYVFYLDNHLNWFYTISFMNTGICFLICFSLCYYIASGIIYFEVHLIFCHILSLLSQALRSLEPTFQVASYSCRCYRKAQLAFDNYREQMGKELSQFVSNLALVLILERCLSTYCPGADLCAVIFSHNVKWA